MLINPVRQFFVHPYLSGRAFLGCLFLVLVIKAAISVFTPLFFDEAYYRIWARDLQWGYYDHPPMIAWWIRLGQGIAGESPLATRLLPLLASLCSSLGIYLLAREFEISKTLARQAAIWTQAVWITALGSMIAVPDAPTSFFWIFSCLCAIRAARLNQTGWWLLAGLLAGLACLSKYTAFFLAPGLLLWLVTSSRYRAQLTRPGPWLAALVALAVFAPNIVWNITHEWMTFNKQLGRAIPEGFSLSRPIKFVLEQFIFIGPIITFFSIKAALQFLNSKRTIESDNTATHCTHFLVCVSAPALVYFLFHGFHSEVFPHWTTPLYGGFALLALLEIQSLDQKLREKIDAYVIASAICIVLMIGPLYAYFLFHDFHADILWNIVIIVFIFLAILACIVGVCVLPYKDGRSVILKAVMIGLFIEAVFLCGRYVQAGSRSPGWKTALDDLGYMAESHQASWLGTSYHRTYAHLREHSAIDILSAQITDRFRYPPNDISWQIQHKDTGLILENTEHVQENMLESCFSKVKKLPDIFITDSSGYPEKYSVFIVSGARKNWVKDGC